ncbi:DUF4183 domain-containing protein [Bacillus mycoides]|uniref:DUF4183 domain-containing protein n=1 Tax=Bacillus mycoides TaxID=1405 RepID=UPI0011A4BE96|nr:DUF4183 domain-containing protein [Bacillus mycoides]
MNNSTSKMYKPFSKNKSNEIITKNEQVSVPKKVSNELYYAISNGIQVIYTNEDKVDSYQSVNIYSPNRVSYINLFINGLLQPPNSYKVEEGKLSLITNLAPRKGILITLQFITFF